MGAFLVVLTNLQLNYIAVPFVTLEFWPSWKLISCVYFYGHVIMLSVMLLGRVFPPPSGRPRAAAGTATATGKEEGKKSR